MIVPSPGAVTAKSGFVVSTLICRFSTSLVPILSSVVKRSFQLEVGLQDRDLGEVVEQDVAVRDLIGGDRAVMVVDVPGELQEDLLVLVDVAGGEPAGIETKTSLKMLIASLTSAWVTPAILSMVCEFDGVVVSKLS